MKDELLDIVKKGGIAIIPTDTVYGIVCDALNEESVRRVYEIKNRDYSKAMIILVSDEDMLKKYVSNISPLEQEIINKYWPGPLTIIFKKKNIPNIVTSNTDEIGIRMPKDEALINLIKRLDKPIVATSANISSQKTITNVSLLEKEIKDLVYDIEDDGTIENESSTIIKVINNNEVKIIRHGKLASILSREYNCI